MSKLITLTQDNSVDYWVKVLEESNNDEIGTKAKNLKVIAERTNFTVPRTLILTTYLYGELLRYNNIEDPCDFDWGNNFSIPDQWQDRIIKKIRDIFGTHPVVVRSSATCEDSPLLSFAGQYSTFLNIQKRQEILKAIRLCYASLFRENAKIYAKVHNVKMEHESMAIAIQEVAPVKISGVMFTADPVGQAREKIIIEHGKGLGDGIVAGRVIPSHIEILKSKSRKHTRDDFVESLLKIADTLEKVFRCPQDIEWGYDGVKFYIFQSRPITTLNTQPTTIRDFTKRTQKLIARNVKIVSRGHAAGRLKIISGKQDYAEIKIGDVVLMDAQMDIGIVKKLRDIAGLIIKGGVLSHIAVIAREFNKPCLISPKEPLGSYSGRKILLDAIQGRIYLGN